MYFLYDALSGFEFVHRNLNNLNRHSYRLTHGDIVGIILINNWVVKIHEGERNDTRSHWTNYASFTVLARNDSSSVMFLWANCMVIIRYQWRNCYHMKAVSHAYLLPSATNKRIPISSDPRRRHSGGVQWHKYSPSIKGRQANN